MLCFLTRLKEQFKRTRGRNSELSLDTMLTTWNPCFYAHHSGRVRWIVFQRCLGSAAWKKVFFPHIFKVQDSQNYVGHLPDRNFFEHEEMKEKRKQEFEKWYIQEQLNYQDSTWDFQQNLHENCKADVMVLSKALEIYDSLMKELNDGISPLSNTTLATYALTVFRNL